MSSIVRAEVVVDVVRAERPCSEPSWYSVPMLVLSWYIGLMSGSVESKLGTRRSRKLPGTTHRSAPGMFDRFRLPRSSVSSAAVVDLPGVATVGAARQLVLGPVVVAAPAAVDLEPAVAADVVGGAEARRDLVAEAELHRRRRPHGTTARSRSRRAGRGSASGGCRSSTGPGRRASMMFAPASPCTPRLLTS